jgi:hypothetical protein
VQQLPPLPPLPPLLPLPPLVRQQHPQLWLQASLQRRSSQQPQASHSLLQPPAQAALSRKLLALWCRVQQSAGCWRQPL